MPPLVSPRHATFVSAAAQDNFTVPSLAVPTSVVANRDRAFCDTASTTVPASTVLSSAELCVCGHCHKLSDLLLQDTMSYMKQHAQKICS